MILGLITQTSVASATWTVSEIENRLKTITTAEKNLVAWVWIKSRTSSLIDEAKSIKNTPYSKLTEGDKKQKSLILSEANGFLSDIEAGKYNFSISQNEKTEAENTIIGYQKDFVAFIKKSIEQSEGKWAKEVWDMTFQFDWPEWKAEIALTRYHLIGATNQQDMEFDAEHRIRVTGSGEYTWLSIEATISINAKMVGTDLYFTLRDYSLRYALPDMMKGGIEEQTFQEMENDFLKPNKGKTIHKKLTSGEKQLIKTYAERRTDTEALMQQLKGVIQILENESLLTPIAKKGELYSLALKTTTISHIAKILQSDGNSEWQDAMRELSSLYGELSGLWVDTPIPVQIELSGKNISMRHLTRDSMITGSIGREKTVPVLSANFLTVAGYSKWTEVNISKTPEFWALSYTGNDGYIWTAKATDTGATASITKDGKEIARASIQSTGDMSWTYSWSIQLDDINYEDDSIITRTFRLFGNLRDEFGDFEIKTPSIYTEFEALEGFKKSRDETRIGAINTFVYRLDDIKESGKKYPQNPKDGCVSSIKYRVNGYNPFDSYNYLDTIGASGTCAEGYYYRKLKTQDGNDAYVLAVKTESREKANYDNESVNVTTGTYEGIAKNIVQSGSTLPENGDWYFVVISK